MNKKISLVCFSLLVFSGNIFAQTAFTDSAKSQSTAGQFVSDSDNINANDIFDINRAFFSAGYQPALTYADGNTGTMMGFWAMPIGKTMTIGIAGEYNMVATNAEGSTIGDGTTGNLGELTAGSLLTEISDFNIRPVFRWSDFAFSYRIARTGNYTNTMTNITEIISGDKLEETEKIESGSTWEHEIGFAYDNPAFKIFVPIGVVINMGSTTTNATNSRNPNTTIVTKGDTLPNNTRAKMYISPEVTIPFVAGPITQFKAGMNIAFDIYNKAGGSELTTKNSGSSVTGPATSEVKKVVEFKGQANVDFDVYFRPTLKWTTWEDKIEIAFEPEFGVKYNHYNGGLSTTTDTTTTVDGTLDTEVIVENTFPSLYTNTVTPYLAAAFGTTIRPVKWFEIRTGLKYKLNWENTLGVTSYKELEGGTITAADYGFSSEFDVFTGFGFIFGEDFFIDIYIQAGKVIDPAAPTVKYDANLFSINAYGAQLSYRF